MKIKKTITREIETTIDIVCDICGKSCGIQVDGEIVRYSYATLSGCWGYWSDHDGDITELHICEKCVDKIGDKFDIKHKMYKRGDENDDRCV